MKRIKYLGIVESFSYDVGLSKSYTFPADVEDEDAVILLRDCPLSFALVDTEDNEIEVTEVTKVTVSTAVTETVAVTEVVEETGDETEISEVVGTPVVTEKVAIKIKRGRKPKPA